MRACTIFFTLVIFTVFTNFNAYAQKKTYRTGGFEGYTEYIVGDPHGDGSLEVSIITNPDVNRINNLDILTSDGVRIIGEDFGPCSLASLNSTHQARLYVKGSAYSDGGILWSTIVDDNAANIQKSASGGYEESMNKLRMINLYSTKIEHEVGINIGEIERALPTSAGMVEYNGKKINTFNGSQLFYHYLGGIRYLDKADQILQDQLDDANDKNDELEQKLIDQQTQIDELFTLVGQLSGTTNVETPDDAPQSSSKILNVFPNPTNGAINIEIGFEQGIKDAKIHIFDISGNYISTQSITSQQQVVTINLNKYNLPTGQYTCVLIADGKSIDTQVINFTK